MAAETYAVPSGQEVILQEILLEAQVDGALWLRLRFLAPGIGAGREAMSFSASAPDMAYLCESVGISLLSETEAKAERIIVNLAEKPVEFGLSDPDSVQYFEAYIPEENHCIWEEF